MYGFSIVEDLMWHQFCIFGIIIFTMCKLKMLFAGVLANETC